VTTALRSYVTNPVSDALKPNPQKRKESQLRHAARAGRTAAVQALIAGGANVNAQSDQKGYTAVHEAVRSRNPATLQAVLATPNVNVDQPAKIAPELTPLHMAAVTENADATRQLLQAGANPLATTSRGQKPEMLASIMANTAGRGGPHLASLRADPSSVLGMLARAEAAQPVLEAMTSNAQHGAPPSFLRELANSPAYQKAYAPGAR
jgi:ankyrin repeat protein